MTEQMQTIISKEVVIEGEVVATGGQLNVYGMINGRLNVKNLVIHPGGKVVGAVRAENISAQGLLQGEAEIKGLLDITPTGTVNGNIVYGALAIKDGGDLTADVRNVPPSLTGDMKLTVVRGKSVRLTTNDISAFDPDDQAKDLKFTVSNMQNGQIICLDRPKIAATNFTQAQLEKGVIVFMHDGKQSLFASFAILVTDKAGARSGPAKTVHVNVQD